MEYFYVFKISIRFVGDELASSELKVLCPFFGKWGFSACGDAPYGERRISKAQDKPDVVESSMENLMSAHI